MLCCFCAKWKQNIICRTAKASKDHNKDLRYLFWIKQGATGCKSWLSLEICDLSWWDAVKNKKDAVSIGFSLMKVNFIRTKLEYSPIFVTITKHLNFSWRLDEDDGNKRKLKKKAKHISEVIKELLKKVTSNQVLKL